MGKKANGKGSAAKGKIFNQMVSMNQHPTLPLQQLPNQVLVSAPPNGNLALNQAQQIYLNQNLVRPTSVGNNGSKKPTDKKMLMQEFIINNPQLLKHSGKPQSNLVSFLPSHNISVQNPQPPMLVKQNQLFSDEQANIGNKGIMSNQIFQ